MPSASPSATATIITSSSSEPLALFSLLPASAPPTGLAGGLVAGIPRRRRPAARRRRRPRRPASSSAGSASSAGCVGLAALSAAASSAAAPRVDRVGLGARPRPPRLLVGLARPRPRASSSPGRGASSGGIAPASSIVGSRPGVPALAHAGAAADAAAQVVELRAPDVAAAGHLDPLDLRRVDRERALDADAERLLADGERLARAVALALDHDALEDLGPAAGALDDLEVDLHAVARLEGGDAAQLRALEVVDDSAHGNKGAGRTGGRRRELPGLRARRW